MCDTVWSGRRLLSFCNIHTQSNDLNNSITLYILQTRRPPTESTLKLELRLCQFVLKIIIKMNASWFFS